MSAIMDMYFNNSESNMSLQEVLDIDIKSEIDFLLGGHNDLSTLNFAELPALDLEDVSDVRWFSQNSNLSNSSFTLDMNKGDGATAMVNPNSVMPLSLAQNMRSPSPTLKESHLTFSPSTIKFTGGKPAAAVKKDLLKKIDSYQLPSSEKTVEKKVPLVKTANKTTTILSKSIVKTVTKSSSPVISFRNTINRQITSPVTVTNYGALRTISTNHGRKQQFNNNRSYDEDFKPFPKPAYSYSCLIAMALKNSRSGSLPVSEIYNFMCKHFPYFKTAPNGWKNSVRHNLSLNKCFEKIEKPVVNGAHRKGCLWAMNPSKINKMDDEVQKWSKKDPSAIRKAMINPENLEALERGELKFSCSYDEDTFGDSCGSAESEEGSDSETEESNVNLATKFISIGNIKSEEEDDGKEFDVEVADSMYEDDELDIEDEHKFLRLEIARAHKELEFDRGISNKRRKTTYIIQN